MTKKRTTERCRKGHFLTNDNVIVQKNGTERCKTCVTIAAQKAARSPRTKPLVRAAPRRKARYINALTPVMLADCQARLALAMEKPVGGRPRSRAS